MSHQPLQPASQTPAPGWCLNEWGQQLWWDGVAWGALAQPNTPPYASAQSQAAINTSTAITTLVCGLITLPATVLALLLSVFMFLPY